MARQQHAESDAALQALQETHHKIKAFTRPVLWDQPEVHEQFDNHVLVGSKLAMSLEDHKRMDAHRQQYTDFIQHARLRRERPDTWKNEADDGKDLGLHPYRCAQ